MKWSTSILLEGGFQTRSLSMDECPADDHNRYVLILRHNGGHLESGIGWTRRSTDKGMAGKTKTRHCMGTASSYTYCQNQLLCKVLGCSPGGRRGTDGNSGGRGWSTGPKPSRLTSR